MHSSTRWEKCLRQFNQDVSAIAQQAASAGVPLAVVLIPSRAQAAAISMGSWPAGYDPYQISGTLNNIVKQEGEAYVDILPDYRFAKNSERGYFAVDGHPNAAGHAMIAEFLSKELTNGSVSALKAGQLQASPLHGQ